MIIISNGMKILEVYEKYKIMPQLQEHQFRVAAVGSIILEYSSFVLNREQVIAACLLHDMGNIIKFDLSKSKAVMSLNIDVAFWQKVKDEFIDKYGPDEHKATVEIAKELGVSESIVELVDCVGFEQGPDNAKTSDFGKKICAYADMRVGPFGVISLEDRMADLRVRYAHRKKEWGGIDTRPVFESALREIEKQIFLYSKIKPEDINEALVQKNMVKLKDFNI